MTEKRLFIHCDTIHDFQTYGLMPGMVLVVICLLSVDSLSDNCVFFQWWLLLLFINLLHKYSLLLRMILLEVGDQIGCNKGRCLLSSAHNHCK